MTTSNSADNTYFDLHIEGLGYLNRIRTVTPKRGDAFLACDISALNGPADSVGYTRFDCRVSGREAQSLIRRCEDAVNMNKKVLIGFKLGDLWTDTFVYSKGDKAGQTGVSLKARLLLVKWIKVDGLMVYQREEKSAANDTPVSQQSPSLQPVDSQAEQPASSTPAPAPVQLQPNGYAAAHAGESAGSFESPAAASF